MDTLAKNLDDDLDLDALMIRVREAALGGGTRTGVDAAGPAHATAAAAADDEEAARESDLTRVIEAQAQWNEHTRKTLIELVECLRTLRDDWAEAQKGLRQEMGRLAATVDEFRSPERAARRAPTVAAARRRGNGASSRAKKLRNPMKKQRRRS